MVERIAISSESVEGRQKLSREVTAPYQRNEAPPVASRTQAMANRLTAAITNQRRDKEERGRGHYGQRKDPDRRAFHPPELRSQGGGSR